MIYNRMSAGVSINRVVDQLASNIKDINQKLSAIETIMAGQLNDIEKRLDSIEYDLVSIDNAVFNSCSDCGSTLDDGRCYNCDEQDD